jgi:putative ABC transport system permease protein
VSTALRDRPAPARPDNGGVPAVRAVIHWAWRLLRREWRQQLLVWALIVVAVAATFVGAAVATNTPPAASAGFGTAQDVATFQAPDPHLAAQIAALRHRFGRIDVIENHTIAIPGSIDTFQLRAQDPRGPFGQPMLALVSGHYPTGPGQVAVTSGVASAFRLTTGGTWSLNGKTWRVTGIVENPQSLLDEFALVVPGQVTAPTQVTVLFDAPGLRPSAIGPNVTTPQSVAASNPLNPETIVLALTTIGMILIALVGVGGFTVLAQRRLRAIGMLGAVGGTDRNIRLMVRANGILVGVTGAVAGFVLGLVIWLAYRPTAEADAHHVIGAFQLPWIVIGPAMALAVLASYLAAARPARTIARVPIVTALSGRPAPPKKARRTAIPGIALLAAAGAVLGYSGSSRQYGQASGGGSSLELVIGLLLLVVAIVLLASPLLGALARLGRRAPIAVRLALRDLGRYRSRSASALAAITLGIFIAVLVCVLSAARFGNVLDYAGPNLASNQVIVYTANGQGGAGLGPGVNLSGHQIAVAEKTARSIAGSLGSHQMITLEQAGASLVHAAAGRNWNGPIYVATPQLLRAFGIAPSQVNLAADVLTMRPGLSGLSKMQLIYGKGAAPQYGPGANNNSYPCPKGSCLANPVIQEVGALPSGTSAPNTVITEHAIRQLGLHTDIAGWIIVAPHDPTAAQIRNARVAASAAGLSIETRNSAPSSSEILTWATVFGIALALGILAMSVGLIRSETASDLRTLTATGASGATRRTITAATAGALALLGAVLGTAVAYVGAVAYSWSNSLDGLSGLGYVPVTNLLLILVGMPLIAAVAGWLLAGRQPSALGRQPLD